MQEGELPAAALSIRQGMWYNGAAFARGRTGVDKLQPPGRVCAFAVARWTAASSPEEMGIPMMAQDLAAAIPVAPEVRAYSLAATWALVDMKTEVARESRVPVIS